jgi:hypothetical protein
MTSTLPKKFEAFAVPGGLKGQLADLSVPEILQQLRGSAATGILTLVAGGARKALYLKDGRVVFASSNLPNDRLGEILLREGKITVEEYDASIKAITKGKRQGRALVEMGALSPKDLWDGVQFQVKEIVYSIFHWDEGTFHFEESTLPEKERITVDLDIRALLLAGIRRVDAGGRLQARYPEGDALLEQVEGESPGALEPYEEHVLELVDGERSVLDICRETEIGDNETMKVLYALVCTGALRVKGRKVRALDQDFVPVDSVYSVLDSFNQMYEHIFKYMVREVGPIAENVLEKYVASLREGRKDVFAGLKLLKDGTIDGAVVERNLNRFPEDARRAMLVDALNELLYAELLAVKRTLGSEHEAALIRTLRDR